MLPRIFGALRRLRRPTPEQVEARRRAAVKRQGRVVAGMVIDVLEDGGIVYEYDVAGVYYSTTQDVSSFDGQLPAERWRLIGPAQIKYATRNPANSIVLCESWSGIAKTEGATEP